MSPTRTLGHTSSRRRPKAPSAWTPLPRAAHRATLDNFLRVGGLSANDVPDAHLAALAIEHGLTLATCDSGFARARFPGLTWLNPLQK